MGRMPSGWTPKFGWIPDAEDGNVGNGITYEEACGAVMLPPRSETKTLAAGDPPVKRVSSDLRNLCSAVSDQGQTNSCVANSIADAMEQLRRAKNKYDGDLSRMYLYWFGRAKFGATGRDSGMCVSDGIKQATGKGLCLESSWAFTMDNLLSKPVPEATLAAEARKHHLGGANKCKTLNGLIRALSNGHPFVFGLMVYDSFLSDATTRTGVVAYPYTGKLRGQHCMCAVGYDATLRRFIVRNSWSDRWGDGGYCYIPEDYIKPLKGSVFKPCRDHWVLS